MRFYDNFSETGQHAPIADLRYQCNFQISNNTHHNAMKVSLKRFEKFTFSFDKTNVMSHTAFEYTILNFSSSFYSEIANILSQKMMSCPFILL